VIEIRTARLRLTPVGGQHLADLMALKADPLVFGMMLGGVRGAIDVTAELAADVVAWGADRVGMFAVHEAGRFQGIAGIQRRPDRLGSALRFAVWPDARGRGVAREAAGAALRFAHDTAGMPRIVAVARAENFGSRMVLGAIGMTLCDEFRRDGHLLVVLESCR
jgi:RimJ/RimL family protein N-acetyltransferase